MLSAIFLSPLKQWCIKAKTAFIISKRNKCRKTFPCSASSRRANKKPVPIKTAGIVLTTLFALCQLVFLFTNTANARSLALVRDAEIEGLLKSYTSPLFKVAGLGRGAVDVYIVNNSSFNAFVTDRRMFIHTGALMTAETPNEIIGVIAHETGHIIGKHQIRMRDRLESAKVIAAVGILLGAGAMAAGGDLGNAAGQAIIQGGQSTLLRSLLSYQRDEESSADRSALTLLNKSGQSASGMLKTFERMGSQLLFSSSKIDPYMQSHPLPRERLASLQTIARKSPHFAKKDPKSLQTRHDMARAKIAAYTGGIGLVRRLFNNNPNSIPARYGIAIAQHLQGNSRNAIKTINSLIKKMPSYAYLYESKADMLLSSRKPQQAIAPMKKAISLDKYKSGLLRIQYGHILLESGNKKNLGEAIRQIKAGLARDPKTLSGYNYLARAHSSAGQQGHAMAATAEARFLVGNIKEAKRFAHRAQQILKKNSPQWVRMQDIVLYKHKKKKKF